MFAASQVANPVASELCRVPCFPLGASLGCCRRLNVFVSKIDPNGSCQRAGIKEGDRIFSISGHEVKTLKDVTQCLQKCVSMQSVELCTCKNISTQEGEIVFSQFVLTNVDRVSIEEERTDDVPTTVSVKNLAGTVDEGEEGKTGEVSSEGTTLLPSVPEVENGYAVAVAHSEAKAVDETGEVSASGQAPIATPDPLINGQAVKSVQDVGERLQQCVGMSSLPLRTCTDRSGGSGQIRDIVLTNADGVSIQRVRDDFLLTPEKSRIDETTENEVLPLRSVAAPEMLNHVRGAGLTKPDTAKHIEAGEEGNTGELSMEGITPRPSLPEVDSKGGETDALSSREAGEVLMTRENSRKLATDVNLDPVRKKKFASSRKDKRVRSGTTHLLPLQTPAGHGLIGRTFLKNFGQHGNFIGNVFDYNGEKNLYRVMYSDGDGEEFEVYFLISLCSGFV